MKSFVALIAFLPLAFALPGWNRPEFDAQQQQQATVVAPAPVESQAAVVPATNQAAVDTAGGQGLTIDITNRTRVLFCALLSGLSS